MCIANKILKANEFKIEYCKLLHFLVFNSVFWDIFIFGHQFGVPEDNNLFKINTLNCSQFFCVHISAKQQYNINEWDVKKI